jgi:NAD(P)H-hydrate epimerase
MSGEASLPRDLYCARDVRELDRVAIEEHGIPGITLMERAGAVAFAQLRRRWPQVRRIAVACGLGNNAGDGFVVARIAAAAGLEVAVGMAGPADRLRGDAAAAYAAMREAGLGAVPASELPGRVPELFVDALLGTGLDRDVEGRWADLIEAIGATGRPVLALDVPSGLHADTGRVLGTAVRADLTVTFIGLKQGLFTGQGRAHAGAVVFDDLGVPADIYERVSATAERASCSAQVARLGRRSRTAYKGAFGHVLVVGGDKGYLGAARLAGEAAARSGAGLVSVATRATHAAMVSGARPELMARGVEHASELAPLLARASVVAVGPGLGTGPWGSALLDALAAFQGPMVVDADGLNLIAAGATAWRPDTRAGPTLLTPHPGEAARLLGCSVAEVEADRFAAVRTLATAHRAVVVLKGAGSLVCADGERVYVCDGGNPGMATGGMGDVLTGLAAALLAQGLAVGEAAVTATCVHAAAGDRGARDGERGLLASDLVGELRAILNGS